MQWRIPILLEKGGVKVLEAGSKRQLPLGGINARVSAGDTVRVVTPPPKPCAEALQAEANKNCRDYAIVPGSTPPANRKRTYKPTFDDLMEEYLKARPQTVLITSPLMMNLDDFLNGIATSDEFIYPIRYLIIVGHASISGAFHISISAAGSVAAAVNYETLEEAVVKKYMIVDMSLMEPRPVGAGPAQLRLLGCSVGAQAPYMKKFKEALGGKITLIAPKFLALPDRIASPDGPITYYGYDFTLHSPTPVKDYKALVNLYDAKSTLAEKNKDPRFTLRSGKRVPKASWNAWVPRDNLRKHLYSSLGKKLPKDPPVLSSPVILPVLKRKVTARRRFLVNEKAPYWPDPMGGPPQKQSIPLASSTGKVADWKAAVRKFLEGPFKHPTLPNTTYKPFDPGHPLPAYVRAGYDTMDEFMDGWDWQFDYDKAKKVLSYLPIRWEYRVWQPITTEPGNELIMNYYPIAKKTSYGKLLPLEQLFVWDSYFFGTY
jgi:hypothetical protein